MHHYELFNTKIYIYIRFGVAEHFVQYFCEV